MIQICNLNFKVKFFPLLIAEIILEIFNFLKDRRWEKFQGLSLPIFAIAPLKEQIIII